MSSLEKLRDRMAELSDLSAMQMLAAWDQLVMMPAEGAAARAQQLGTLARLTHERSTGEQVGEWLGELDDGPLDELDADIVRLARRDWERARRVPIELAAELARAYGECVAEAGESAYDGLLGDYDFGLSTGDLRRVFSALAEGLTPLVAEASAHTPHRTLAVPVDAQEAAVAGVLRRVGVDAESWRVDVSAHPFTAWIGPRDSRVTTRYGDGEVESLLSSLHEFGHALYERQIDPALDRTNLGSGTSMSIHESQSKLWENHVARSRSFAEVLAEELAGGGFTVTAEELHATLVGVQPSLIRVSADPLTYPLHIILRFELELAMIEGTLAVADLPQAWREGMARLLGVEVPSDALGCLQDVHWGSGSFGYFPSYALGCLIAAQLWEAIERELGPREEDLSRGETGSIQSWLAERVHRHGRRLDTLPLLLQATGEGLAVEPFLRYVSPLAGD
jgi:carboxypeptidase Taq